MNSVRRLVGKRWFSSGLPAAQARVDAIDNGLVLLRPNQLQDTGRLKPGAIFRSEDGKVAAVAVFKMKDAVFGACLNGKQPTSAGTVLTQTAEEEMRLTSEPNKRVFDDPPRDMARTPITQSWFLNEPVMDLMTPIGVGQSMIFFLHRQSALFSTIQQALHQQQIQLFFPENEMNQNAFSHDQDIAACLSSYLSLTKAEVHRDTYDVPVVCMVTDLTPFRRVWERADLLFRQEKAKRTGDKSFLAPDSKPDRTDLRHYYSSFIQRAARLKDSNKSLTLLLKVPKVEDDVDLSTDCGNKSNNKEFSIDEFESEVKAGIRDIEDFERLVRLRIKTGNRIKLTAENLAKLQISLPASAGGGQNAVNDARQAKMHGEELMSIVDGHVVSPMMFKDFCLDPRASLTRIGVGSNKNEVRDTRPALIRSLALGLRIDVADLYDSVHADPIKAKLKLEAWKRALNMKSPLKMEEDKGRFEAALIFAVRRGLFNQDVQKPPTFNLDAIRKLDLNKEDDVQNDLLAKCISSNC